MHRFFLPPEACRGVGVTLDERDSHHALRVLRIEPGEVIEILDGSGGRLRGRVGATGKRTVTAAVLERFREPPLPRVILVPAILKGRGMDLLIQKATELGATEIWPTLTERTVVRLTSDEAVAKVAGWRETAIEACKQCGNPWLPRIGPPRRLPDVLSTSTDGLCLVASLEAGARLPGEIIAGSPSASAGILLFTGPEGDFSAAEHEAFRAAGARPVTLGPLVLRAETAVIAALAVVQHELRRQARDRGA